MAAVEDLLLLKRTSSKAERSFYLSNFGIGLELILVFHMLLTTYRDFFDNFAIEILLEIGYGNDASNLDRSEVPITFGAPAVLGCLLLIKNNRTAIDIIHVIMIAGSLLVGISTWLFQAGKIDLYLWLIMVGLGLYVAYVPIQAMLSDRLIAVFKSVNNA